MFMNLFYGLSIMAVRLLLQSLLILIALRYYVHQHSMMTNPSYRSTLFIVNGVMLPLVVGNIAQVSIWAFLFKLLGEFRELRGAFYHSAVNFSTLGYGDMGMSEKHRLLGPLEAINGVLMIGVSTAALMASYQDTMKKTFKVPAGR